MEKQLKAGDGEPDDLDAADRLMDEIKATLKDMHLRELAGGEYTLERE